MASKGGCLRCPKLGPGQLDIYKHGNDLAKCQKQIKADSKPYELKDMWPLFGGSETATFKDKDEAREFIEPVIQSVRDGIIDQPWSKDSMEAAAQLAFPASEANKKKQKAKLVDEMSSLSISVTGPSSSGTAPSQSVSSSSAPAPPTSTSAVATTPTSTTTVPASAAPTVPTALTLPTAPVALADPSGPHFMIQQVQRTNQAAANQYAQDLAGRLAEAEHNDQQRRNQTPEDKQTQLSKQQRDDKRLFMIRKYGLRSGLVSTQLDQPIKPFLQQEMRTTDFYLQSHFPIQGTGRSAHYFVLRNNIELSVDDLQMIIHTFCYAYARATKGVSYCAPAYYADRLCDRGRAYLRHFLVNKNLPQHLPNKQRMQSWDSFKLAMKKSVHNRPYYRPDPSRGENPWDPFLDDMMFYL